jgi:AraC-like DNA-binding protein
MTCFKNCTALTGTIAVHGTPTYYADCFTNTTLPIKEIADECGLENYDYFFTLFRRLTGMTPSDYRNNTQGK